MLIENAEHIHDLVEKRRFYMSVVNNNGSHYIPIFAQLQAEDGDIRQVEIPSTVRKVLLDWLSDEILKIEAELKSY